MSNIRLQIYPNYCKNHRKANVWGAYLFKDHNRSNLELSNEGLEFIIIGVITLDGIIDNLGVGRSYHKEYLYVQELIAKCYKLVKGER